MPSGEFRPNQTYDNVFLIFLDAAGHSSVVANNPRDLVYRAMDLLYERVVGRLTSVAERYRCARAQLWRWAGDGGFLVVHDDDESIARNTALDYVRKILELDLGHVRDEFADLGIRGELRIRIAVHRGTLRYRGEGLEGSIYASDINFAAHLEKAAPPDTALVSAEVRQVAGDFADLLEPVGSHEDRPVYLFAPGSKPGGARQVWLARHGLANATPVHAFYERPSQQEKVRLLSAAGEEVIYLGTSLRTASHYLVTNERPALYRDAVLALLRSGVRYRCVMMDPESVATGIVMTQRGENLVAKINQSLADLRRFKDQIGADGDGLEVHLTSGYPAMGCMATDLDAPHGMILISPYLMAPPGTAAIERADMPNYLIGRSAGRLYDNLRDLIVGFARTDTVRVL